MPPSPTESKTLLALAWPLVISFTARSLLSAVDLPYASHISDSALAAIGLFFPLEFLFVACWVGTSAALTSHLSRAMGERHEERLRQLVRVTTWVAGALTLLFLGLAGLVWAISDELGLEPATAEAFGIYAPVAMAGIALFAFWSVIPDSIVKAHHDTKTTMIAGLISGFTNLGLNTLFVFGFGFGLLGIALATGLSRVASLAYSLWRMRALEAERRARWAADPQPPAAPRGRRPGLTREGLYSRPLSALLALGIPSALTYVLMGTEQFLVNAVLLQFEDATASVAAYAVYHRAVLIVLMPIIAVGVAVLPFVARLVGEGHHQAIRAQLYRAFGLSAAYVVLVATPLCFLLAEPLARWLGNAETTQTLAGFAVRYGTPLGALVAMPFILCRPAFEALQRGGPGLLMAIVRYLLLAGPLAWAGARMAREHGFDPFYGLIAGLLGGTAVTSVAFLVWLIDALKDLDEEKEGEEQGL